MNILFIHEVDWLEKVVFDMHILAESLSLLGHHIYAIDYEDVWHKKNLLDWGSLKTKEIGGVSRALPHSFVHLSRPGFIKIPCIGRISAVLTHYRAIAKIIKEKSIEAIVLYGVPTNGLGTIRVAKKFKVPVIFRSIDILNQLVPYPLLRPATKLLERQIYSKVDVILTLTPKLSEYVIRNGAKSDKVQLLPMPVDTNAFCPHLDSSEVRQKWGLEEKDKVVLFMGTLFEFSGLDILLSRFNEVIEQVADAKLLIVGDGTQRIKLERIIAESNLQSKVIITGFQPYHTMPQYINLATVCINSFLITDATRDIFPGKTVQFLACGKALVATALPGMTAVIQGEDQGVVYTPDISQMVREIVVLLKSGKRRQRLGKAGLDYVKQAHGYDKVARQLEAVLQQEISRMGKEVSYGKV